MPYTQIIVFIIIIILVILTSYNFIPSPTMRKTNKFSTPATGKKKVKFGNKVTRVDYDKTTGDIITAPMSQRLNDSV